MNNIVTNEQVQVHLTFPGTRGITWKFDIRTAKAFAEKDWVTDLKSNLKLFVQE